MNNRVKHNPIVGCMRWGTWGANFTTGQYQQMIEQCIEIGLDEFDHADIYGDYTTEAEFGAVLKGNSSLRNKMKLITKCGIKMISPNRPLHPIKSYDTSSQHIKISVETSLKNLNTDCIDTLLIHRPDTLMDPNEIAETINALKQEGKIKHFGVSNFTTTQVELIQSFVKVEQHQVEISTTNLNAYHNGVLEQAQLKGIEIQSWSPLGNGLFDIKTEAHKRILDTAEQLSFIHNTSVSSILLAFLYMHPVKIIPVMGTTKIERLIEAKGAMEINLSRTEFYQLWTAATGEEVA
jgi:predicted oxidoreductase